MAESSCKGKLWHDISAQHPASAALSANNGASSCSIAMLYACGSSGRTVTPPLLRVRDDGRPTSTTASLLSEHFTYIPTYYYFYLNIFNELSEASVATTLGATVCICLPWFSA